jgi:hypothetical protein
VSGERTNDEPRFTVLGDKQRHTAPRRADDALVLRRLKCTGCGRAPEQVLLCLVECFAVQQ